MVSQMTESQVQTCTDVDELWSAFMDARQAGDDATAERIRARMAQLQEERTLRELDDDQLLARIEHAEKVADEREDAAVGDLTSSPPGPVARLSAMLEEAARRGL